MESLQGIDKLCDGLACIGDDWKLRTVLVGIEGSYVDVHELHVRVLERGARCRGEVAVAGTNTDDDICLTRNAVRGQGTCSTDAAEVLRVIPIQHAAACLRSADRNAGLLNQGLQLLFCRGIQHAAACDDHWILRITDDLDSTRQGLTLRTWAADVPLAILQEFKRDLKCFCLHVLGQGDRHGTSLSWVSQYAHRR